MTMTNDRDPKDSATQRADTVKFSRRRSARARRPSSIGASTTSRRRTDVDGPTPAGPTDVKEAVSARPVRRPDVVTWQLRQQLDGPVTIRIRPERRLVIGRRGRTVPMQRNFRFGSAQDI